MREFGVKSEELKLKYFGGIPIYGDIVRARIKQSKNPQQDLIIRIVSVLFLFCFMLFLPMIILMLTNQ